MCMSVCVCAATNFESQHSRTMGSHSLESSVINSAALTELSAFFLIINGIIVSLKVSKGSHDVRYEAADAISTLFIHQCKQV